MGSYFSKKTVMVTGGSSGIGLALSRQLAREGARVILIARRQDALEQSRCAIMTEVASAQVELMALDVSVAENVNARISELAERLAIDILINNAGVVMPGRFLELDANEFRRQMDINYFGAVNMCRAVLPQMVKRGQGQVLNVSSLAGVIGIYGYTAYAASKFALLGFSQALRAEMWPLGVSVSVCLPPDTDTPQLAFENQYKPSQTRAIAGTVKTLSASQVAKAMLRGLAKHQFEIYPNLSSLLTARSQGIVPRIVRWFCDHAQRKAATKR